MRHDYEQQKTDTFFVFHELKDKNRIPDEAILDFQFIPETQDSDWSGFEKALKSHGYNAKRYVDGSTLEASVGPVKMSAETIWKHEIFTTELGLKFKFQPDGWGYF